MPTRILTNPAVQSFWTMAVLLAVSTIWLFDRKTFPIGAMTAAAGVLQFVGGWLVRHGLTKTARASLTAAAILAVTFLTFGIYALTTR